MKSVQRQGRPQVNENPADGTEDDEAARILVVDDDAGNLVALRAILSELGQPIVCAKSGDEALRYLLNGEFAVILLDAFMPGLDGYETAELIRSRRKTEHVPIIFLSAINKEAAHLTRGYEVGAVDYVFKPVDPLILRSKVAVFIELHKRAQEIKRQAELEKRLLADNVLVRTEQRRTEAALERSMAQQSLVIESLPLALYSASPKDGFRSRRLVGGRIELLGGRSEQVFDLANWTDKIHPADLPQVLEALGRAQAGATFSADYRFKCPDGSYRWFTDRAAFSTGEGWEQFGILLDITERRQLEEQLIHAQKMEFVGQMTGGIAHDFNNMLGVIIGSLDRALAQGIEDSKLASRLDLAMQAANSCADLTKRLLSFSRRQALEPRRLCLEEELSRLRKMFDRLLDGSITLRIDCGADIWAVYIDPSQLEAAIINLLINARDAMPDGGHIDIIGTNRKAGTQILSDLELKLGDYVELTVIDDGPGMSEEVRARAFEPFFTTKESGKGTGLGLSSLYGFIRQSGGSAVLESKLGKGTTIRLFLPKAADLDEDLVPPERAREHEKSVPPGLHVLLVEDEEKVRLYAASMLEELGCRVTQAANGDEALKLLEGGTQASVLFTDCMMPGTLDGPQLARKVWHRMPGLPVLFTSGVRTATRVPSRGGHTQFLAKPYTSRQLAEALLSIC
jgi:signal transduction histidine kinase/FixJ family two-component response regulator